MSVGASREEAAGGALLADRPQEKDQALNRASTRARGCHVANKAVPQESPALENLILSDVGLHPGTVHCAVGVLTFWP